jgi:hypothetical protein
MWNRLAASLHEKVRSFASAKGSVFATQRTVTRTAKAGSPACFCSAETLS